MRRHMMSSLGFRRVFRGAMGASTTDPEVQLGTRGGVPGQRGSLPGVIVRRRRWIAGAWIALAFAFVPGAVHVEEHLDVSARADGSESDQVARELSTRFGSPFARSAILVATGLPSPSEPSGRHALRAIVASLEHTAGVTRTISYLDTPDTLFLGALGAGTLVMVGLDAQTRRPDTLIAPLRATTAELSGRLRAHFPAVTLRWTGEVALNADLRRVSATDAQRAERRRVGGNSPARWGPRARSLGRKRAFTTHAYGCG